MNDVKIDMWSNILKNIHRKIPNDSFITWFDNISLEEFSDSEITIGVPNKFVKTFIIEKFSEVLADAISANIGENKTVKYKVIPELRNKVENARLLGINLKDKKTIDSELILPIVNSNEKFTNTHQNQDFFPFDYSGLPLVQSYKLDNFSIIVF